jgi:ABC-type glycerol-3-phosphate transport system permease component
MIILSVAAMFSVVVVIISLVAVVFLVALSAWAEVEFEVSGDATMLFAGRRTE